MSETTENTMSVEQAMNVLRESIHNDLEYAHSWYSNIEMMCYDAIKCSEITVTLGSDDLDTIRTSQDAAKRFMKLCFNHELT